MIAIDALRGLLLAAFPDATVEITDLTGTSDHFQAVIVSRAFEGKTRIEQHKMVYASLGDAMKSSIHALSLKTQTP